MLLGMGFSDFSMNAMASAETRKVFTRIHYTRLRRVIGQLGQFGSRPEIEAHLSSVLTDVRW